MLRLIVGLSLVLTMMTTSSCDFGVQSEWTLHRTADGAHPDGIEQEFLWMMNRARHDPAAEGEFLANIDDPLVQSRITGFGVDVELLGEEFDAIAAKPPAAFDVRLYEAASGHSLDMIAQDLQTHTGQTDRVIAAGFQSRHHRGNAYAYAQSPLEGHAAFNIDWGGSSGTGMQNNRPHRRAVMSIDGAFTNVGIAAVPDEDRYTQVGPWVVTANFEEADETFPDHYNRFLVGTVWTDLDGNGAYDPGEGHAGVTVTPSTGPYFAVTAAGGGYAIPVLAAGDMEVTFLGLTVPAQTESVSVYDKSVRVDHVVPS